MHQKGAIGMTLHQKTLLSVSVTLLCLLMTLYFSLSSIWLNGFAKIESQQTHADVERVIRAIGNDLRQLNHTVGDWAVWDETMPSLRMAMQATFRKNLATQLLPISSSMS
jgi:sensor domain CHASE-containing protein